jgi:hypothetical protein
MNECQRKPKYQEKTSLGVALFTTDPTWPTIEYIHIYIYIYIYIYIWAHANLKRVYAEIYVMKIIAAMLDLSFSQRKI